MSTTKDYDSSKTRVCPAFSKIKSNPKPFFQLLKTKCGIPIDPDTERILEIRFAGKCPSQPTEKALPPTPEYLKWLIRHIEKYQVDKSDDSAKAERLKLFNAHTRDKQLIRADNEIDKLDLSCPQRKEWFILEGDSKPDVFLKTTSFYLIIEGKRTESGPKVGTTWDPKRHQIVRHIENLIQLAKFTGKKQKLPCYGIFIVEESKAKQYQLERYTTDSHTPFYDSLPHLTSAASTKTDSQLFNTIVDSYKGFITWQELWAKYQGQGKGKCIKYIKHIEYYDADQTPCD